MRTVVCFSCCVLAKSNAGACLLKLSYSEQDLARKDEKCYLYNTSCHRIYFGSYFNIISSLLCFLLYANRMSSQHLPQGPLYWDWLSITQCLPGSKLCTIWLQCLEGNVKVDIVISTSQITHHFTSLSLYPKSPLCYGRITHRSRYKPVLRIVRLCSRYKGPRSTMLSLFLQIHLYQYNPPDKNLVMV